MFNEQKFKGKFLIPKSASHRSSRFVTIKINYEKLGLERAYLIIKALVTASVKGILNGQHKRNL